MKSSREREKGWGLTWAMINDAAMNHTPNLVALDWSSSRNRLRRSIGDQIASPKIVSDDELTIMPTKLTREKPRGTDQN